MPPVYLFNSLSPIKSMKLKKKIPTVSKQNRESPAAMETVGDGSSLQPWESNGHRLGEPLS